MDRSYFILSPGRCGSILASYIIKYSLNTLHNLEDYCHMQHVKGVYQESLFNTSATVYHSHDPMFYHKNRNDCDFVLVLRKNKLDGCLSFYLAQQVFDIWTLDSHIHYGNKLKFEDKLEEVKKNGVTVDLYKFKQAMDFFDLFYNFNIGNLKTCFIDTHILYYEDFKQDYMHINRCLGIPEVNVPTNQLTEQLPYNKWELINNKTEVIELYESRATH